MKEPRAKGLHQKISLLYENNFGFLCKQTVFCEIGMNFVSFFTFLVDKFGKAWYNEQ